MKRHIIIALSVSVVFGCGDTELTEVGGGGAGGGPSSGGSDLAGGNGAGGAAGGGDEGGAPPQGIIDGPEGEWVYYEIPGAVCANGTPTGLGVNQGPSERIVVFMSPGSACLDENCSIGTSSMRKDGGFGAPELEACVAGDCDGGVTFPSDSIFDRASKLNPFRDATYVFISVCSGDYYIGDNVHAFEDWTATFQGSQNQALFAAELARSFPETSRVVLTGGSAGSVGAMLNYWQWIETFDGTRVDLVSDSFALVEVDGPEFRYDLHAPQLPPGCTTCADDYRTVYDFNSSIAPDSRIAVIDSENNWTLDLVAGDYTEGLQALQPRLDLLPNTRYFVADGNVHVLFKHPLDSMQTDVEDVDAGTRTLGEFLWLMQLDDEDWESFTCLGE